MLLKKSQLAYFGNTLNEVLNGFTISDFYVALGTAQEMAEALRNRLDVQYQWHGEDAEEILFTEAECLILRNASLLCLERLPGEAFEARLGESPQAAQKLLRLMDAAEPSVTLPR